jgi:hypothetical protein
MTVYSSAMAGWTVTNYSVDTNPGPASQGGNNSRVFLGFNVSVSATLGVGPLNDVGCTVLGPNWESGSTNRLILTAATNSGNGTQINGVDASGVADGFTLLFLNPSTTDPLIFNHLNGGSLAANRFSNANGGQVQIPPQGAARATYIVNLWYFN